MMGSATAAAYGVSMDNSFIVDPSGTVAHYVHMGSNYASDMPGVLAAIDQTLAAVSAPNLEGTVQTIRLHQNHPNPFESSTSVTFELLRPAFVSLAVYDVQGRLVHTLMSATRAAGRHAAVWDGKSIDGGRARAGVYYYRLFDGEQVQTRKMVRLD